MIYAHGRSVLAGFSSEQELGLISGDVGDGGEDVRAVYSCSLHAVAMINATITRLTVQRELHVHTIHHSPIHIRGTVILKHVLPSKGKKFQSNS